MEHTALGPGMRFWAGVGSPQVRRLPRQKPRDPRAPLSLFAAVAASWVLLVQPVVLFLATLPARLGAQGNSDLWWPVGLAVSPLLSLSGQWCPLGLALPTPHTYEPGEDVPGWGLGGLDPGGSAQQSGHSGCLARGSGQLSNSSLPDPAVWGLRVWGWDTWCLGAQESWDLGSGGC